MLHRTACLLALVCLPTAFAYAEEPPVAGVQMLAAEAEPVPEAKQQAEADKGDTSADAEEQPKPLTEKELRDKMRELENELQEARRAFQQKANEQRDKIKQESLKALDNITLPKDPTREQCEAYVEELRMACEGRRSYSSSDPATKKLKAVPAEHFDLLVAEIANRTSLRYYANYAMQGMDPEKLREQFVGSLAENPENISIIVMHGWTQDVRDEVIRYMQTADGSVPPAWFQAAVEIDEPTLYPKLHEVTTQSRYASQFITMLEMLPDYDLAHTIDVCWRRAGEGKLSVGSHAFAAKAAEHGNVDALGALIEQVHGSGNYLSHATNYNIRRANVLKLIDYRGSNTDIKQWYKLHQDELVFDHLTKRFMVPEDF